MRVFSTFTGIGGFEIGIERAFGDRVFGKETNEVLHGGDSPDGSSGMGDGRWTRPVPVGYSEIDKYAIKVYEKQFPGVPNYGDITKINAEELPDFDCLVGGFPCQAFSIAGKRKGFEDTRGTLFFDLARILRAKQPRLFVFENVKGLLSHDGGRTFKTIIQTIDELGYDCQWQVLNSKNHGVPQNRERVYIVGHLRGTPRPQVFPIAGTDSADTFIRTIRTGGASSYTEKHARDIIQIHTLEPRVRTENMNGDGFWNEYTGTIRAGASRNNNLVDDTVRIRRLTPKECERLQGFPDNWTAQGTDGAISDTQRYKMCGNAVTTNVAQAVFERIFNG